MTDTSRAAPNENGTSDRQRSGRFRFKATKDEDGQNQSGLSSRKRHSREHGSPHRSSKRRRSMRHKDSSHIYEHSTDRLSKEQAFRESLFDALGDDEGANFWEGVYGQPIHQYPDTYQNEDTGELERMSEDEYAQFVRRKMWEKSWEGIEAQKREKAQQREEQRQRLKEERSKHGTERPRGFAEDSFDTQIEASLRRGQKRKDKKRWQELWRGYLKQWTELQALARDRPQHGPGVEQLFLRNKIAWPVESGKRGDIDRDEIERFVRQGASSLESDDGTTNGFADIIKTERVRWHPDKIQQRYGFMDIDDGTLKGVTAVFQSFDAIWNEIRQGGS